MQYMCPFVVQEKLLANLDEDQQNDAGFTGGDEVPQQAIHFINRQFQSTFS